MDPLQNHFSCSRCSSDRLPPRLHNAPWKMAGRSSVFGPMPRETLLTNMSNDPGAADNDFARPVSEGEEGKREEDQEGGRRRRMNCDAKLTQTSFVAPPASGRGSGDLGQLIRLGSFRAARGGGSQAGRLGPRARGKSWRRCLNRSLTTARCDHRARERR